MKKLAIILTILVLLLAIGFVIPKIFIRNAGLGSGPCVKLAQQEAAKFPNSLFRTAKITKRDISSVEVSYYTLFGIRYGGTHMLFCNIIPD
jgi:hypothetical protein